jgi:hypothetical protein
LFLRNSSSAQPNSSDDKIIQDFDRETRDRDLELKQERAVREFEDHWTNCVITRYQRPS